MSPRAYPHAVAPGNLVNLLVRCHGELQRHNTSYHHVTDQTLLNEILLTVREIEQSQVDGPGKAFCEKPIPE